MALCVAVVGEVGAPIYQIKHGGCLSQRNGVPTSWATVFWVGRAGGFGGMPALPVGVWGVLLTWHCGRRVGYRTDHASHFGRCKVGSQRALLFCPIMGGRAFAPHEWRGPYRTDERRACGGMPPFPGSLGVRAAWSQRTAPCGARRPPPPSGGGGLTHRRRGRAGRHLAQGAPTSIRSYASIHGGRRRKPRATGFRRTRTLWGLVSGS
jgi:hypothetical protein